MSNSWLNYKDSAPYERTPSLTSFGSFGTDIFKVGDTLNGMSDFKFLVSQNASNLVRYTYYRYGSAWAGLGLMNFTAYPNADNLVEKL